MSENTTIARPYAKAVFQIALESKTLMQWSLALMQLSKVVLTPAVKQFIQNPSSTVALQADLILSVVLLDAASVVQKELTDLVQLLAKNKRLLIAHDIFLQFESMRAAQEKTKEVEVIAVSPLTSVQEAALIKRLGKRLQSEVTLKVTLDPSLLGGVVIRAGDFVIDDSVRCKLMKLGACLAA